MAYFIFILFCSLLYVSSLFIPSFHISLFSANPFPRKLTVSFPNSSKNHEILLRRRHFEVTLDAAYGSAPGSAGMRTRAPYDANNTTTSTTMTTLRNAKLIDDESAGQIGRGQGVNHFRGTLSRSRRLSHDIVSRTANTTRRIEAPKEKGDRARREKKRVAGAFCGFGVGNGATKGSPPA